MCERERVCACDAFTSSDFVVTAPERKMSGAQKKKI